MRDLDDGARFLSALTRETDGYRVPAVFQTFDDQREKRPWLARVLAGTLADVATTLLRLEAAGAGVFVTVQRTTPRGRRTEDVISLRAAFTDADGPVTVAPAVVPSIEVESRAGKHTYWLLHPGEPLELFGRVQRRLADFYRTDPTVRDLARVMRLPGFLHQKGVPFLVRLRTCDPTRVYSLLELVEAHGGLIEDRPAAVPRYTRHIPETGDGATFAAWAAKKPTTPGCRNHNAYVIAAEGLARGLSIDQVGAVVVAYCERAGIPREAGSVIRSAVRRHKRSPFTAAARCGAG